MPFIRTSTAPERIFLFGGPGAGKTAASFSIARKLAATNDPARLFLIDTDNSYFDLIDEYPEAEPIIDFRLVDQVEEGTEWTQLEDQVERALKDSDPKRNDWIVIDRVDPSWEWAQDDYVRKARKQSIDEVRAEGREKVASGKDKNLRAGLTGFEWGEVKTKFRRPFNRLFTSGRNIIVTAGATKISQYTDSSGEKSDLFGGLPWSPAGGAGSVQIAYMCRDALFMRCTDTKKGLYFVSTGKPRGRPVAQRMENEPVKDFAYTVLTKKFGWRARGIEE